MRTVDPEVWCGRFTKPAIKVARPWRYGRQPREGIEAILRSSFCDAMREYGTHSSLQGIKYLTDINTSKYIKYFYAFLITLSVLCGVTAVVYVNLEYHSRPPLQVNLQGRVPDTAVPFPAVAICSNCLITKKALHAYYAFLVSRSHISERQNVSIMSNLINLGALITLTRVKMDLAFLRFLYDVHPDLNITDLMYKFSPKCSSMLKRCSWKGHNVECQRLFAVRVTPLGFCCVFNSRYQPEDIETPPKILNVMGRNYGLSVVVTEDPEEFAVVRNPVAGFNVLLFDGAEYPLLEGGSVRMYPVSYNSSSYFVLTAHAQYPSPSLRTYSEDWRGCRIKQLRGPRTGRTSYSWCLTECRQRATVALCNCIPFTLLPNRTDTVCTQEHLFCLNKHKEKLVYYFPGNGVRPGLDEELQDSQMCLHCAPDCARVLHTTALYYSPYIYPKKLFKNLFSVGISLTNTSIVRFYYDSLNHQVYTVEVNLSWYEAFATLGCQTRLLLGFSLMSVSELAYYCTIRWAYHILRRSGLLRKLQQKIKRLFGSRDD